MADRAELFGWALAECLFSLPPTRTASPLMAYAPIATLVTRLTSPNVIVDLGVANSSLLESLSSAVRQFNLDTSCYGVFDGSNADRNSNFSSVMTNIERNFPQSTVLYGESERTVEFFADGSIDVLTISFLSNRSDITSTFEKWRPKLSDRAIVLVSTIYHPTPADPVRLFWKNISGIFPSFELSHQFGMGILFIGNNHGSLVTELKQNLSSNPYFASFFRSVCEYIGGGVNSRMQPLTGQSDAPSPPPVTEDALSSDPVAENLLSPDPVAEKAHLLIHRSRAWKILRPVLRRFRGFRDLEEAVK
ncbi:hypothetical protein [Brucella intermedia]|uniref:hypothetical protein n=1 Tax=Brucella intermedia TaxID=94625 RepID=UPI00236113C1|nr:hypothetical protein [Brucella intermedia]